MATDLSNKPVEDNAWRRYFVQTLALWGVGCVLAMMFLDGGRAAAYYSVGSGLFWIAVAAGSYLRIRPSRGEILAYRIGPAIMFAVAFILTSF